MLHIPQPAHLSALVRRDGEGYDGAATAKLNGAYKSEQGCPEHCRNISHSWDGQVCLCLGCLLLHGKPNVKSEGGTATPEGERKPAGMQLQYFIFYSANHVSFSLFLFFLFNFLLYIFSLLSFLSFFLFCAALH